MSRQFLKFTYPIIEAFPQKERYNLVDQIRRASTSIALNLAEMTSRSSYKEQAHFSEIAYGSAIEVYCAFLLSYDLGYINDIQLKEIQEKISEISNKINSLKNTQFQRANNQSIIKPTTIKQLNNQQLNK